MFRLTVLALCLAMPAAAQGPRVLDTLVLTETTHPDLPLREVSGLAWDPGAGHLYALSDRNDLTVLALDPTADRLDLRPITQARLTGPDGERLRRRAFSVEGVALQGATLWAVSEDPPSLARFDTGGRWVDGVELPPALADPSALRSPTNGLESLTLHPTLGWLAAPETPLASGPRTVHILHGASGPAVAWHAEPRTAIKAAETLPDGRILVLERHDGPTPGTFAPYLRVLDPAACPAADPCVPPAWPLALPTPWDADFEGVTWLGNGRILLASDDRINDQPRTVLVLLSMP